MKRLLIFHPIIAPYRIDFFNTIYSHFNSKVCLFMNNLDGNELDYSIIQNQINFKPLFITQRVNVFRKFSFNRGVFPILKDYKADIVLVSEVGLNTICVLLFKFLFARNTRVVSMIDDSYAMAVKGDRFSFAHSLAKRFIIPLLNDIICVEPRVADYFQKRYGKGVFFPIIADDNNQRLKYELALHISNSYIDKYNLYNKKVLLFVGRLVSVKNVEAAVTAFKTANVNNAVFIIVGDGPLRTDLEQKANDDSRIIFVGKKEYLDLFAWYNIASVFILPSTMEPFGAVTNEALLGGCFSLISCVAGSQCLIEDGVNGKIIDPYDIDQMASEINVAFKNSMTIKPQSKLRPSLMLKTFTESIETVINVLDK